MEEQMRAQFTEALRQNSLVELQKIPKSDLHSHAGRGGRLSYIREWANARIEPPKKPFDSLFHMQEWFEANVKCHCIGVSGYLKRIEAAFVQAQRDNISVLAMSFSIGEIDSLGGMRSFSSIINELHRTYSPNTNFYPELAFGRETEIGLAKSRLDEILLHCWFRSVDICNNEFAQPIKNFKPIYRRAKESGLRLKAHVGEFGSADDVMEAVEELELDEVHHGVAAARSTQVMKWLAHNKIQLNVCPTSNVMLQVVDGYVNHPIRVLYDNAIRVTVNTDDLLIFDQSASEEYLNLFKCRVMTAEELNTIRKNGLKYHCAQKRKVP